MQRSEVFHIQDLLNEAGTVVCNIFAFNLIAFTADKYPELAFRLMEIEEPNIARDEAIDIIIGSLIENCSNDDLELYLAVIKTLPRWKNGGTSEAHFIHLNKKLLLRAIHFNNNDVITKIVDIVKKFNTLVELEEIKELNKFSEILIEKQLIILFILCLSQILLTMKNQLIVFLNKKTLKDKFIIQCSKLSFEELVQLLKKAMEGLKLIYNLNLIFNLKIDETNH